MRTVKEVSEITGISVRTLHYYDEIGLFRPAAVSEAGYRLYDDKALETLQQILFFREFDMPLKEIKAIMENPDLDRNQILLSQKRMLEQKKERLERLISSMEDILKGENRMDFKVFDKEDIEGLYQAMVSNMTEETKRAIAEEYGDMEKFHQHYTDRALGEQAQKNFSKMIEWYGDKESALDSAANPPGAELLETYQKRLDAVMKKLARKRGRDADSFEVKEIIGEYGFVFGQLYQLQDEKTLLLEVAASYRDEEKMRAALDEQYGPGTAEFFAEAVESFYGKLGD